MEKKNENQVSKNMIVFEKNQPGNYVDYDEEMFNAITGNAKPSIEIRFARTQFGEFITRMNNHQGVGVLLMKTVGLEMYFQPCGDDQFMQDARNVAKQMKMPVLE